MKEMFISWLEDYDNESKLFLLSGLIVALAVITILLRRRSIEEMQQRAMIQKVLEQMLHAFAKTIDKKDEYTRGHSFRVAFYSEKLARKIGYSEVDARRVYHIALMHDIGKILIPIEILNKPERLTDEEYEIIKSHPAIGEEILNEITSFPELSLGAGYHHECYDGSGYPHGAKGDEIPKIAQIIAVADTFDAMFSTRPYRKQMDLEDVLEEIKKNKGTQFNPEYAEAFIQMVREEGLEAGERKDDVQWW